LYLDSHTSRLLRRAVVSVRALRVLYYILVCPRRSSPPIPISPFQVRGRKESIGARGLRPQFRPGHADGNSAARHRAGHREVAALVRTDMMIRLSELLSPRSTPFSASRQVSCRACANVLEPGVFLLQNIFSRLRCDLAQSVLYHVHIRIPASHALATGLRSAQG
jgi:hypothetical protein